MVQQRPFASALATGGWPSSLLVLVALGAASIIFDGLSQTELYFQRIGAPGIAMETLLLAAFCGLVIGPVLIVARRVSAAAVGAGIIPAAAGYLVAHYLVSLLEDGQRIVVALSDPLQQGWDLFGTAFYVPSITLSAGVAWSLQLGAVVGGHVIGAWAAHTAARGQRGRGHRSLALLMVVLTSATLWSLGQTLAFEGDPPQPGQTAVSGWEARRAPLPLANRGTIPAV